MGFIAPAGTPIAPWTALRALLQGSVSPRSYAALRSDLMGLGRHSHCWLTCTGRAGMTLALSAMQHSVRDPARCEVIIPAYTCYSVPAAVSRAGLRPRLCDVSPRTLSLDLEHLESIDTSRVLAVVSANLYGLPNDLPAIEAFARRRGILMFDDAAQAMGAGIGNRPVGGFGDVGLFSFDKGKNITSVEGGALVASNPAIAAAIDAEFARLLPAKGSRTAITAIKLMIYSLALRPAIYGLIARMPLLGLGRTPYDDRYLLGHYSRTLAGVAHELFADLPDLTRIRTANAAAILQALAGYAGLAAVQLLPAAVPAYARLPVLVRGPQRDAMIAALTRDGIGATASYPSALNRVPEVAALLPATDLHQPGAEQIAATIMTLPTHPYSPPDLGPRIRHLLDAVKFRAAF
jgi:dTDP-4-amino-4,6-dideoxygalactose transaminase